MILDVIKAILFVGIPVGAFSFLMVYYAYYKGYLSTEVEFKYAFKKSNENQPTLSKKHKKEMWFFHSKWVSFGGGFYGLIALLTFVVIELSQVFNFLLQVDSWQDITALFSVSAILAMFIDSIMNMIKAAIWFTYWPGVFNTKSFIVWILIAYVGYRFGAKYANDYAVNQQENEKES